MHVWKPSGSLAEEMQDTNCVGERHLFHYFSLVMRRCDVVFEAIATNWLKWLQRAGGWPRSSRPSPRARPTFSLSGLGHTSCLAATSLSPNLHPPLPLSVLLWNGFCGGARSDSGTPVPIPGTTLFQVRLQARDRRFLTSSCYLSCCSGQNSPQNSSQQEAHQSPAVRLEGILTKFCL